MCRGGITAFKPDKWKRSFYSGGMILFISLTFIVSLETSNLAFIPGDKLNIVPIKSLNITGMPVKVDGASVINPFTTPEMNLSISNLSNEKQIKVHLIVFFFDQSGKPKTKEEFTEQIDFTVSQSANISYIPAVILSKGDSAVLVLQRVIGRFGVWSVALSDLEVMAKATIRDLHNMTLMANYTEHLAITDKDKTKIQMLSLQHVLNNKEVGDFFSIKNSKNINLLSKHTEPSIVKKLSGVRVNILSLEDLKKKADYDGEIYYFEFTYINFEGTNAQVSIAYEYRVREHTRHTPCCGYVTLMLSKDGGNWNIVKTVIEGR